MTVSMNAFASRTHYRIPTPTVKSASPQFGAIIPCEDLESAVMAAKEHYIKTGNPLGYLHIAIHHLSNIFADMVAEAQQIFGPECEIMVLARPDAEEHWLFTDEDATHDAMTAHAQARVAAHPVGTAEIAEQVLVPDDLPEEIQAEFRQARENQLGQ
jgi:hypothetical protein